VSLIVILAGFGLGSLLFGLCLLWLFTDLGFFEFLMLLALLVSIALVALNPS